MTEISRPWGGIITGDAGPYTDDHWTDVWERFLGALADADTGILSNILNELVVTGAASPVTVSTGVALNDGTFYINDAPVEVDVPVPVGAQRIDRIVLRKDWALQTVRIYRIAGVEGGGAEPLVQIDGTTWDIPLFEATVAFPGGAITLVDERERLFTRIPSMTTAERDAMTAVNGMKIYNETLGKVQVREGGVWRSQATLTVAETQVYNAAAPVAWTDLDLSAVIGAVAALVLLKINHVAAGINHLAVRKNGDVDEFYSAAGNNSAVAAGQHNTNVHQVFVVATDDAGVIEWMAENARDPTTVDVMAYIT